ncbi:hypothetical protein CHARACLAT_033354 [Characodon lateralis]|uniref:Uncharacterized protein n=1 Tax=Characodon lateralis TaxID=208331 RepID=A0ABU7DYC7_9TELE|nr:hypothetical protein [Characodon lateralis]
MLKHSRATPGLHRRKNSALFNIICQLQSPWKRLVSPQQASITHQHDDSDPFGSSSVGSNPNCLHNQTVKTQSCPSGCVTSRVK